ncbi:MAG: hypothetical protein JW843_03640 [Candidatus Aminicenantes bacterium]|nr:hypothetical protein [Candidatus Aminicenantes bacterium]
MAKKTILIAGLILASILAAFGQSVDDLEDRLKKDPDNKEILLALGRIYHDRAGLEGQSGAEEKAEKHLRRLLEIDPDNASAMVNMGSVLTIQAGNLGESMEALDLLNRGFALMDRAVLLAPRNPEIRLVRAVNSLLVPEIFGRNGLVLGDFEAIQTILAGFGGKMPSDFLLTYHFYYGTALAGTARNKEAEDHFKKVIELAPGSSYAAQAKKRLGEKRRP